MVVVTGDDGGSQPPPPERRSPAAEIARNQRDWRSDLARTDGRARGDAPARPRRRGPRVSRDRRTSADASFVRWTRSPRSSRPAREPARRRRAVESRRRSIDACRGNYDCEGRTRLGDVANERGGRSARRAVPGRRFDQRRTAARNLRRPKTGKWRSLVCTDVAARGIDVAVARSASRRLPEAAEESYPRRPRGARGRARGVSLDTRTYRSACGSYARSTAVWLRTPVSAVDVKVHTVWLDEPGARRRPGAAGRRNRRPRP